MLPFSMWYRCISYNSALLIIQFTCHIIECHYQSTVNRIIIILYRNLNSHIGETINNIILLYSGHKLYGKSYDHSYMAIYSSIGYNVTLYRLFTL